jgi:hypothetical protein
MDGNACTTVDTVHLSEGNGTVAEIGDLSDRVYPYTTNSNACRIQPG